MQPIAHALLLRGESREALLTSVIALEITAFFQNDTSNEEEKDVWRWRALAGTGC